MENGMLWYIKDPSLTLEDGIMGAKAYFEEKYGGKPNICHVNPGDFQDANIENIKVEPSKHILPRHLLIGLEVKE